MAKRLSNTLKILRGDGGSPEAFTTNVGNVIDFNGPNFTNERVDVTDGDSPANSKEFLSGRQEPGALSFNINFDFQLATHIALITDAQASPATVRSYRLQPSEATGDYLQGPAFVSSFALSGSSRDTALTAAVGFQPSANWTPAAA